MIFFMKSKRNNSSITECFFQVTRLPIYQKKWLKSECVINVLSGVLNSDGEKKILHSSTKLQKAVY